MMTTMRIMPMLAAIGLAVGTHAALADGDAARGEQKFVDCAACHAVENGVHNIGPSLHGAFGHEAGGLAAFRSLPALNCSGISWTVQHRDQFIADPPKIVPANRMPYGGMTDASDRADLIAYLQKATK